MDAEPLIRACELIEEFLEDTKLDNGQEEMLRECLAKIDQVVGEAIDLDDEGEEDSLDFTDNDQFGVPV